MKYIYTAAALLAATVVADKRDLCSDGSTDDNGNYYCQEVDAITYTGVGGSGSYNAVTDMDSTTGDCSSSASGYSGSMSPLDQEVRILGCAVCTLLGSRSEDGNISELSADIRERSPCTSVALSS